MKKLEALRCRWLSGRFEKVVGRSPSHQVLLLHVASSRGRCGQATKWKEKSPILSFVVFVGRIKMIQASDG
jgi:hypothetical protein